MDLTAISQNLQIWTQALEGTAVLLQAVLQLLAALWEAHTGGLTDKQSDAKVPPEQIVARPLSGLRRSSFFLRSGVGSMKRVGKWRGQYLRGPASTCTGNPLVNCPRGASYQASSLYLEKQQ